MGVEACCALAAHMSFWACLDATLWIFHLPIYELPVIEK